MKTVIVPIEGYTGYFISNKGKVYCNLGKGNRDRTKTVEMYEVKPRPGKNGYMRVYARSDKTGKRKDLYVHRLVALHFIPNLHGKKWVNHKNCKRWDNDVRNLEWSTAKENNDYAFKMNRMYRDELGRLTGYFVLRRKVS